MMKHTILVAAVAGLVLALAGTAGAGSTWADSTGMQFVTVGDPGNTGDTVVRGGVSAPWGAVAYEYDLGKYEVTNYQYTVFLSAAAATDTWGLYNGSMGTALQSGITRSGSSTSYTYAVKTHAADGGVPGSVWANKPVNYVNWNNAAAFCNWQTTGDVTSGYYSMTTGGVATPNALSHDAYALSVGHTVYFIPTEDEMYKAAYYKGGSTTAGYWDYATQTDSPPVKVTANATGDGSAGATGNFANHSKGAVWNGIGNVTTVGTNGGPGYYGTHDLNGNLFEWNEGYEATARRGLLGGAVPWGLPTSAGRKFDWVGNENYYYGFRVSSVVPEPATMCLLALGGLGMLMGRRRHRV